MNLDAHMQIVGHNAKGDRQKDDYYATPYDCIARHCQNLSSGKIAMLLKLTFLEGIERKGLFLDHPPARIWVFSKRVSLMKNGKQYKGGMMALAWFVWEAGLKQEPRIGWI